jgi:hypothetical protein
MFYDAHLSPASVTVKSEDSGCSFYNYESGYEAAEGLSSLSSKSTAEQVKAHQDQDEKCSGSSQARISDFVLWLFRSFRKNGPRSVNILGLMTSV